nr:hypothetical protein [Tanacetum cinerariifolium]
MDRYSAALLFPYASRLLTSDSVYQIPRLFLTTALGGSNHSCCALFHCDSSNTYLSFPCWVLLLAVLAGVGVVGVLLIRFLKGCLITSLRLRLLLAGGTLDWDVAVPPRGCDEDLSKPFKEVLKCPFTRRIVEFSSPDHRMSANVKIYDGTGDPEDHMGCFVGIGNQGEWQVPVWCRMFQQTLDGKARAWFNKLPSGSIDNWGSLQEKFLNIFGMLKACDKDLTEISKIAWKANETLPHFKERASKTLLRQQPKTMDEMLKRVDDYLRSEEAFRSIELPGGFQRRDTPVQWIQRNDRSQRFSHGNNLRRSEH